MRRGVFVLAVVLAGTVVAPTPPARAASPPVTLFVQFDQPSAYQAYRAKAQQDRDAARRAAADAKAAIRAKTDALLARFRGGEISDVVFRTANAVPGVAVHATAATARELAREPGVRSVRRLATVRPGNASADQLGRAVNAWQQTGRLGTGVRIGIVDTGIDYTHADLGGPGTPAAYAAIDPTETDPRTFPTAKVLGGVDLAGNDYDADSTDPARTVPQPDDNPLDCEGHGTHVAGTAAGLGESPDGSTFRGDHRTLTPADLDRMRIGPGAAPGASLYAIKVFGCTGGTALAAEGLDRALDPNGDGDFSDRVDVVNLSLGAPHGAVDDPVNDFVGALTENGVLVVASAGNTGDVYDSGGAPGTSPDAIAVASVRDPGVLLDAVEVAGLPPLAGDYSADYPDYATLDRTLPVVVPGGDPQGCSPYDAQAAARARGNIVWLEWPDDPAARTCKSKQRADRAAAAGAAGVLLAAGTAEFGESQIGGDTQVPVFRMTGATTAALRPLLATGLRVRMAGVLAGSRPVVLPEIADTLSDFSARGLHGPIIKPDVSAPGDTITSALSGSGTGRIVQTGTSMASPFVAGVAALVREAHPDWNPAQVKAAIMNTADGDVVTGPQRRPVPPMRAGAGRIDARAALTPPVLATDADRPGAVSVGFGTVDVPPGAPFTATRRVRVTSTGAAVTLDVGYRPITTTPGVTITAAPARISVPAGGAALVDVTVRVPDPAALRRSADPTLALVQKGDLGGGARQYLADAAGRLELTGGGTTIRVPVGVAPRPASRLHVARDGDRLAFSGRGVDQGTGPEAYVSRAGVFTLVAQSPQLPRCTAQQTSGCVVNGTGSGADLRYVGITRTANGTTAVAFVTWADLAGVGTTTNPTVLWDLDGDDRPDRATELVTLPDTDVLVSRTVTSDGRVVDVQPVNGFDGSTDTHTFDTDSWVLPVGPGVLGAGPIRMLALVRGDYGPPDSPDRVVDAMPGAVRIDPRTLGPPPAASLVPVTDGTRLLAPVSTSALVIVDRNPTGGRAFVVPPPR
ncbi:S8 family serine peptidase [Pseudonocardia sp. CA-107938]|uniref:S8 family serine peptidase n=1 Tax=Pseudonocardia sp. CA-107938 TaxID=3240021 RepID=UPI003D8E742B